MTVKEKNDIIHSFLIKCALLPLFVIASTSNSYCQIDNHSTFSFQKLILKYEGKVGNGYYYSLLNLTDSTFNNIALNATFFEKTRYAKYSIKFNLIEGDYPSIKITIDTLKSSEIRYFILPKLAKDITISFSNK
jgi:hypothetical protein